MRLADTVNTMHNIQLLDSSAMDGNVIEIYTKMRHLCLKITISNTIETER